MSDINVLDRPEYHRQAAEVYDLAVLDSLKPSGHPQNIGFGRQFDTYLAPSGSFVLKIPKSAEVVSSIETVRRSLGGLVAPFEFTQGCVVQDSLPNLRLGLNKAWKLNPALAKLLIHRFIHNIIQSAQRGVVNWDPKFENYGLALDGEVLLVDIGGNVSTEEFLDSEEIEGVLNELECFCRMMGERIIKNVPHELLSFFYRCRDEHGFGNKARVIETIRSLHMTESSIEVSSPVDHYRDELFQVFGYLLNQAE